MSTTNKPITNMDISGWVDSNHPAATADGVRTISTSNAAPVQVCAAATQPLVTFYGHPIDPGKSIALRVTTGDKIWVLAAVVGPVIAVS